MQYPIIDNLINAYLKNGWTGLELTYGKNLIPFSNKDNITWATDWINPVNFPGFSDFINTLDNGQYTFSCDFEVYEVLSIFTSETATARAGNVVIHPGNYSNYGYEITRQQALENYSNNIVVTFTKSGLIEHFYSYGLGRDFDTDGAPKGQLGKARFYNMQIEKGTQATPYEPYAPPTTDIKNRMKLPVIHYFPHPVIDALQRAAAGTQTADDTEILRHYLTPLGIGGI